MRKIHNLTQEHNQNGPIYCQMKDFYFALEKIDLWSLGNESRLFLQQNLDFKHFVDVELSLEEDQNKGFKD